MTSSPKDPDRGAVHLRGGPSGRRLGRFGVLARAALAGALLATGCASAMRESSAPGFASNEAARGALYSDAVAAPMSPPAPARTLDVEASGSDRAIAESAPSAPGRLMIYRGHFEVLVGNVEDAVTRFLGMVEDAGGYLERRDDGDVTCRIPAARYFGLLDRVPSLGQVLRKALEAEDVTRQVTDLEIRLENAEVSRKRLLDLLATATETEAILKIEQELRRLTVEIEQMKASLTHLRDQIAYSTLRVTFHANAPEVRPPSRRGGSLFPWIDRIGAERVLGGF